MKSINTLFHFECSEDHGYVIVLDSPITFSSYGYQYIIEKGYKSNGMSVPRMLWGIISPPYDPRTIIPSIIHDWMYDTHILSRKQSDAWYRDELIENEYPAWKAYAVYYAIRIFGSSHW